MKFCPVIMCFALQTPQFKRFGQRFVNQRSARTRAPHHNHRAVCRAWSNVPPFSPHHPLQFARIKCQGFSYLAEKFVQTSDLYFLLIGRFPCRETTDSTRIHSRARLYCGTLSRNTLNRSHHGRHFWLAGRARHASGFNQARESCRTPLPRRPVARSQQPAAWRGRVLALWKSPYSR